MKSLYDEDDRYTTEAGALEKRAQRMLAPLFAEYASQGYSIRDIGNILIMLVTDLETESMLSRKDART